MKKILDSDYNEGVLKIAVIRAHNLKGSKDIDPYA
jgi:hypothetical protein